jgi:hypothetical protein
VFDEKALPLLLLVTMEFNSLYNNNNSWGRNLAFRVLILSNHLISSSCKGIYPTWGWRYPVTLPSYPARYPKGFKAEPGLPKVWNLDLSCTLRLSVSWIGGQGPPLCSHQPPLFAVPQKAWFACCSRLIVGIKGFDWFFGSGCFCHSEKGGGGGANKFQIIK